MSKILTANTYDTVNTVEMKRSTFNRSFSHKTTFNVGELVPIMIDEVLPGDTHKLNHSFVARLSTPIHPIMDNLYFETFYFFVPNRLVWTHWQEFMGENKSDAWWEKDKPTTLTDLPQMISTDQAGIQPRVNSIWDHFGLPTGTPNVSVNALPFRAYLLIWNEWFRDQNLQDPILVKTDSTNTTTGLEPWEAGKLLNINKRFDYFTSCLPGPQKGPPVSLPLVGEYIPVITAALENQNQTSNGLKWKDSNMGTTPGMLQVDVGGDTSTTGTTGTPKYSMHPTNLVADLSKTTAVNINQLRTAFAIQRMYELDARGGTRYIELIKMHFKVSSDDARLQRPEYLGGKSTPININQVLQMSSTDQISPQGNTAAYSLTSGTNDSFEKSFTEHGYIIGLAAVRQDHSYQTGAIKLWNRKKREDFYLPVFANLGEQIVYNKEIFATGLAQDNLVFGYQAPWEEYRHQFNTISGAFRSGRDTLPDNSLDVWHLGDKYTNTPILDAEWIKETNIYVDRTLTIQSTKAPQILNDNYFEYVSTRVLPLKGTPGGL